MIASSSRARVPHEAVVVSYLRELRDRQGRRRDRRSQDRRHEPAGLAAVPGIDRRHHERRHGDRRQETPA